MKIWDNKKCSSTYGNYAPAGITSHMLCAGKQGKDSCSVSTRTSSGKLGHIREALISVRYSFVFRILRLYWPYWLRWGRGLTINGRLIYFCSCHIGKIILHIKCYRATLAVPWSSATATSGSRSVSSRGASAAAKRTTRASTPEPPRSSLGSRRSRLSFSSRIPQILV
jgi:hypothetical protein